MGRPTGCSSSPSTPTRARWCPRSRWRRPNGTDSGCCCRATRRTRSMCPQAVRSTPAVRRRCRSAACARRHSRRYPTATASPATWRTATPARWLRPPHRWRHRIWRCCTVPAAPSEAAHLIPSPASRGKVARSAGWGCPAVRRSLWQASPIRPSGTFPASGGRYEARFRQSAMIRYLSTKSLRALLTIAFVVTFAFAILRLSGDPALLIMSADAPPEAVEAFRRSWGLDRPLWEQYFKYFFAIFEGSLGRSMRDGRPALDLVLARVPQTLAITIPAFFVKLGIGIPAGIYAALHRNSLADRTLMIAAVAGHAVPSFVLGLVLVLIFAVRLNWLPSGGSDGW